MTRTLDLGGLRLPVDVVTQTIAIVAKRRAGKSYTMRRLVEQLVKASQQVVLVDPKGDQWGIRSARDGKAPGLPVLILGGERGDAPLVPSEGEYVARFVVEERPSLLLDLSQFSKGELATFMAAFLETLYRLKAREANRTPMMLVIDEADAIAPQKPMKGVQERMLGAANDIVRRGGQRGIGCVLVTQRSAVLNKDVLTQAQMLVVLRTIAPQDIKAMRAWIEVHGTDAEAAQLIDSLPSLPIGDAWFWSPGWPTEAGIFKRVHVDPIETFDSGATPKAGEKRVEPKNLAEVDLEGLRRQMASTIERAKAEDPRELRKRISELERQLKAAGDTKPVPSMVERVEVPVIDPKRLEKVAHQLDSFGSVVQELARGIVEVREEIKGAAVKFDTARRLEYSKRSAPAIPATQGPHQGVRANPPVVATSPAPRSRQANGHDQEIGRGGLRRILVALAQRPKGLTRAQLGVRAQLSSRSGTFDTYLSRARQNGWIDGRDVVTVTADGLAALGEYQPLPEGRALLDYWLNELGQSGAARILGALAGVYPRSLNRQELAELASLSDRSGTFDTYLSRLRTLELIDGRGELRASEEFFQ